MTERELLELMNSPVPHEQEHLATVRQRVAERTRRRSWIWAWPVAVACAALLVLLFVNGRLAKKSDPVRQQVQVVPVPEIGRAPVVAPVVQRGVVKRKARVKLVRQPVREVPRGLQKSEPVVVKILTDDPNVVIVWLGD